MNTIYPRMLLFDNQDLVTELRQRKGKLVTHQTKWISNFQKASISSEMVDQNSKSRFNQSINSYTNRNVVFSYLYLPCKN